MRQSFQGQPWHSERWRVNSQDSNRKSKAKKPSNRTGGNGWKESSPQNSKPRSAGPDNPSGAGRQRLGCRDPAAAGCPGRQPLPARHPLPALSLSEELGCPTPTQPWDTQSSLGSPCLQGGHAVGRVKHRVQQGAESAPTCSSPLPGPQYWGWSEASLWGKGG